MSDSFADLWFASAAIQPKRKEQTLASVSASVSASSTSRSSPIPDAFSLLANPAVHKYTGKRSTTVTPTPPVPTTTKAQDVDAFSDIFSSAPSSQKATMTIAERLALEAREKASKTVPKPKTLTVPQDDSPWLGLDSLVRSSSAQSSHVPPDEKDGWEIGALSTAAALSRLQSQKTLESSTLLDLDDFISPPSPKTRTPKPASSRRNSPSQPPGQSLLSSDVPPAEDEWDFSALSTTTTLSQPQPQQTLKPSTLWELEDFASPPSPNPQHRPQQKHTQKPTSARHDNPSQPRLPTVVVVGDEDDSSSLPANAPRPPSQPHPRPKQISRRNSPNQPRLPGAATVGGGGSSDVLAQASEIGLSVLSKASAFLKEGKHRVVKVYEEHASTVGALMERDVRPKWVMEVGFRDGEGEADEDEDYRCPRVRKKDTTPTAREEPAKKKEVDLFSTAAVVEHEAPLAAPTRDRPLPTADASTLAAVDKHRKEGGAKFTLGQYGSAIESYTAAIDALPARHLLLLPLLNNRALARLRTGEHKRAAEDARGALDVVVSGDGGIVWDPSMDRGIVEQRAGEGGWAHPQGLGVDLVEGYAKALRRRAEGCEGCERWAEALRVWEVLSGWEGGVGREARRSAARCRKMIVGGDGSEGAKAPAPKPRLLVQTTTKAPTAPSAALRSLQATAAQAEAEDALKHQLKDAVDGKIAAWRAGKEANVRALLASLDMVLWEEVLRGVRVGGLHELVSPAQVKKGYVKAIARVHPDKVCFFFLFCGFGMVN